MCSGIVNGDLLRGSLRSLSSLITPPGVTPVPSTVSLMVGLVPGFTVRRLILSLVAPPGENHCGKRQFVFSTMASMLLLFFYHGIHVPRFASSRAETLTTVRVNRTSTDLDTDSLHSLITLPGVTPVPSTVSPMVGLVPGFTVGRLLSLVAPLGETTVPSDSLFFLSTVASLYLNSQSGPRLLTASCKRLLVVAY